MLTDSRDHSVVRHHTGVARRFNTADWLLNKGGLLWPVRSSINPDSFGIGWMEFTP
ncbi:MAG: hypothetical protein WAW37_03475 [Syntrophobacteraceae bacterium]